MLALAPRVIVGDPAYRHQRQNIPCTARKYLSQLQGCLWSIAEADLVISAFGSRVPRGPIPSQIQTFSVG